MPADSTIVLLPRFTTLIGASASDTEFTSLPLDVSKFGSAQFQLWVGKVTGTNPTFSIYLEESLDTYTWVLGSSAPRAIIQNAASVTKFVSYAFRLRWFRIRVVLGGNDSMMVCWAEGLLR